MPTSIQILISVLAVAVAITVAIWQNSIGNQINLWISLATGGVMLFGIWIFPEAKGGREKGG